MRSLFVMAARLKASTEGRSLENFHVLLERDNVQISQMEMTVCGDSERL